MPLPSFLLGTLLYGFIGAEAVDHVKMPFGLDLAAGATSTMLFGLSSGAALATTVHNR